jgi:competence protein ComEA
MHHRYIARRTWALLSLLVTGFAAQAAPVDINSADAATLARELKGVGDAKAATIVEYRRTHGGFKTVDDLALVKGIGAKLVERNRADLRLGRFVPGAGGAAGSAPAAAPAAGGRTVYVPAAAAAAPGGAKGAAAAKSAK